MGAIQSSINQAINIGGLLYTQTGAYKAKQDEIAKKKAIKSSEIKVGEKNQVAKVADQGVITPNSKASAAEKQLAASAHKDLAEAAEEAFKLNPTELTKKRAIQARGMSDITSGMAENKLKIVPYDGKELIKQKQANEKAMATKQAKVAQKTRTLEDIRNESVANYMKLLKEDK